MEEGMLEPDVEPDVVIETELILEKDEIAGARFRFNPAQSARGEDPGIASGGCVILTNALPGYEPTKHDVTARMAIIVTMKDKLKPKKG